MDTLYDADRINDPRAIIEADRAHVWHHLIQNKVFETVDPRIIVEGKGLRVWDIKGKEHVDAVSGGVWTVNIGYGRERVADAVRDQLVKMCYFAGSAGSIPGARYSEALTPGCRPQPRLLRQLGLEANEKAFKMVRQIAHKHHGGRKHKILYRDRDYHGTTIACLSAGGQQERNAQYGPFAPASCRSPTASNTARATRRARATASAPRTPSRR
jgi:taurine-pyruvate aminotransferase